MIHLVRGDDPVLVGDRVRTLVDELLGEADRSLAVEELDEASYRVDDGFELTALVDAAQTPPLLTGRRVVVGRELARFTKGADVEPLVRYLADPLPTTALVLVWDRGPSATRSSTPPKALVEAIEAAGGVTESTSVGTGRAASAWLDRQLGEAPVRLDRSARTALADRLGEDHARLSGLLDTLHSRFGDDRALTAADIEPFLGEAGSVPPWDLTDAIAEGNVARALERLHRMTDAGGRHPLELLAILFRHYEQLLRLDGADVTGEKDAAALLGLKGSTYPAKKALAQLRRMRAGSVARAIDLLGSADLDLRGATAVDGVGVLEVLVARLCRL